MRPCRKVSPATARRWNESTLRRRCRIRWSASDQALRTVEDTRRPRSSTPSFSARRFPWFGKLELRERQALFAAAAATADVEAKRLALVTEARRLYYELAFLGVQERVLRDDRATLGHYEELSRARYASGVGLEQAVIKLQAEITRDDNRLLELANRRAGLVAALDALRDRAGGRRRRCSSCLRRRRRRSRSTPPICAPGR